MVHICFNKKYISIFSFHEFRAMNFFFCTYENNCRAVSFLQDKYLQVLNWNLSLHLGKDFLVCLEYIVNIESSEEMMTSTLCAIACALSAPKPIFSKKDDNETGHQIMTCIFPVHSHYGYRRKDSFGILKCKLNY